MSIVCAPASFPDGLHGTFSFEEQFPQPCALTWEDAFSRDLPRCPRRCRPNRLATGEPCRWAEVLFEPGDVIELRCIPARRLVDERKPHKHVWPKTARQHGCDRWVFASEIDCVVDKLTELNGGTVTWWGVWNRQENRWADLRSEAGLPLNVYASANPRIATGCTKSDDVLLARSLFVDLEDTGVEEALAGVDAAGLPLPTMSVVSGHGVHLYWRLGEPITDLPRWTAVQKRLIRRLGSDEAIHDPARLMRLPGFMNVNGDPAPCRIHDADPGRRYDLGQILPHLPLEPPPPRATAQHAERPTVGIGTLVGPHDRTAGIVRATAYADRFEPVEEGRNVTLFRRACALVENFDLTEKEVRPLIADCNDRSANPLDDSEVEQVVGKAVRHVTKKDKPRGKLLRQLPVAVEEYRPPSGPVIDLAEWRRLMTQARVDSLGKEGKVFFDGSPTGAGKSTADLEAMKRCGQSATFLPTHDACEEFVKKLAEAGLKAAAHPPW